MGVLDKFTTPDVVDEVLRLEEALNRRFNEEPRDDFLQGHGVSRAAIRAAFDKRTAPAGIFGAGVISFDGYDQAAVFVMDELLEDSHGGLHATPIWDTQVAPLIAWYTQDFAKQLLVVGLPQPQEQHPVRSGDALTSGSKTGTCGVEVVASSGARGVLSAGHVLPTVGAAVVANGSNLGTVSFTDSLSKHQPGEDVADVAVVDLDPAVTMSRPYGINAQGSAKSLDSVIAHGQSGNKAGRVLAAVPSFAFRPGVGSWKDALLTDRAISQGGDSGAPVYLDDGSGTIIGHIVAGHTPAYSVIQDISYLLQEANATLA